MNSAIIKYFFISLCISYIFAKLTKRTNSFLLKDIIFSIFSGTIVFITRNSFELITLFVAVLLCIIYFAITYKLDLHTTIIYSVISTGLSYGTLFPSALFIYPVLIIAYKMIPNTIVLDIVSFILIGLFQSLVVFFVFNTKRLRNGIHYINSKITTDMGVFLSVLLLVIVSLFLYNSNNSPMLTLIFVLIILTSVVVYLWINRYLKSVYLERVNLQNIKILNDTIESKNNEIEYLKGQNAQLSKIIHKGNKIIPSLELAVTDLIQNHHNFDEEKAQNLIQQLKILTQERKGIVSDYEKAEHSLPKTNIAATDGVLRFLYNRAVSINCSLDISLNAELKNLFNNIIDTNDFNIILADLVENAIISTKDSNIKKILIVISIVSSGYRLDIFDSGICFDSSSFLTFGIERTTTHKDNGGSGIGLMTTLEILQKVKGSLEINEALDNSLYTKCVALCFDNENQFRVHSNRTEVIDICKTRTDITLI